MSTSNSNNNEPAFVSVDLESSLGIIQDNDDSQMNDEEDDANKEETNNEISLEPVFEHQILMMDNKKVTRTSDSYPFANSLRELEGFKADDNEEDEEEEAMDESDSNDLSPIQTTTATTSFDPIPVSDQAEDLSMMLMDEEAKQVLVNRIGEWNNYSTNTAPSVVSKNGFNIVPNDWVNINVDLSETEVDDEDGSLELMLEEEAKESGFVLENIGDRQSFWNSA